MARYAATVAVATACGYALRAYVAGGTCTCHERLDGKTVVVTGGNAGIGRETAVELAKRGARVYIACRDMEKSQTALEQIRSESGSKDVFLRYLDLASFASIREFAKQFQNEESKLHVLVNNAATRRLQTRMITRDGLEMQMGVNHFGHFLLTNLLLDQLKASAPSRIIFVSSIMHKFDSMDLTDLQMEKSYSAGGAYCRSKLANLLCTEKLHRLLQGTGVSVFAVHPGGVATDPAPFQRGFEEWHVPKPVFTWFVWPLLKYVFFKTPRQGAQTTICCCLKSGLEDFSGRYFADCKVSTPSTRATDTGLADKLWEVSERICQI